MEIAKISEHAETTQLRAVAECLQKYLRLHGRSNHGFDVLRFLADETLARLETGSSTKFHNLAIQIAVVGQAKKDPSAWLSPVWRKLTSEILPSLESGLQEFARAEGLSHYPWVNRQESTGGAGNQTLYYLEAREIPEAAPEQISSIDLPPPDISYIPAANLQPSWWARWLFGRGYSVIGWRKVLFVFTPLIWLMVLAIFVVLSFLLLSQSKAPVTTQDILALALLVLVTWHAKRVMDGFFHLVDDRIAMASDHVVGFKEFGVCLELAKPDGASQDGPRSLRLVKYAAECPICHAEVLLDAGEPDFPRRIVGRCQESPREHIFSFDRVRRSGYRLR